jgi:hypothetical protein
MYQNINNMHFVNKRTLLSIRTTTNLRIGFDELKNNCSIVIAGVSSSLVTPFSSVMDVAASSMIISALFRRQDSKKGAVTRQRAHACYLSMIHRVVKNLATWNRIVYMQ